MPTCYIFNMLNQHKYTAGTNGKCHNVHLWMKILTQIGILQEQYYSVVLLHHHFLIRQQRKRSIRTRQRVSLTAVRIVQTVGGTSHELAVEQCHLFLGFLHYLCSSTVFGQSDTDSGSADLSTVAVHKSNLNLHSSRK